ncbi:RBBP9/YdeN family alpha/beta hydrolase [Crenobacter caeni]|uniref:Alpha/beta hydrolase n=1 Tax=Crenobacter caeni TaxID=2705474 RepID=A0A6B2KVC4_9NEIS|nr:alpha/beta hydrolase [Crenobacter caeni]NDV14196.1 alpha/beta hydrolase [Crenobacter caeni]
MPADFDYVIQPGWNDSPAGHWQSHWQQQLTARRPRPESWQLPQLDDWVDALRAELAACRRPVIVVAHSLGCVTLAHYSARFGGAGVAAALLVAPADVERADAPEPLLDFAPLPKGRLPFPARVVASDDDPFCRIGRARVLAEAWGAPLSVLAGAGHINAASGHARWDEGFAELDALKEGVQVPTCAA